MKCDEMISEVNIKKVRAEHTRAIVTVKLVFGIIIRDIRIINRNGAEVITYPSKKQRNGIYVESIRITYQPLKEAIERTIWRKYR